MFDSLAAGVPIIQNTTGWIECLVNEREIGINVKPNNSLSMANAIRMFISDEIGVADLRINSLKCAREMFDRKEIAMNYLNVLSSLQ
jgi:glycosyltransferase involved in cell wall biosynthesis